jgi:hypothetical protein
MNLEFDDSNQVEIYFMYKVLRRRYKGHDWRIFDRHGDTTRVAEVKFLFGADESRKQSLLAVAWNWSRATQSAFHYRETGEVDLGNLGV